MRVEDLVRDPVMQLNLLLWMAKEQPLGPGNYRVNPVFARLQFRIVYIEQPFPFPVETEKAIAASDLAIHTHPEPEMILKRENDLRALYLEAKTSSFAPDSTTSAQARGHLLAVGPAFPEAMKPLNSCLLCYFVPESDREQMDATLDALRNELVEAGLSPGTPTANGMVAANSSIQCHFGQRFLDYTGLEEAAVPVMDGLTEDTNPSPLLLVFSTEDHHDPAMQDFYRRTVVEQVRAALLTELQYHPLKSIYVKTAEEILQRTTRELFGFLGSKRQKALKRFVRHNVLRIIHNHWEEKQRGIVLEDNQLRISWESLREKQDFLDWLMDKSVQFGTEKAGIEPQGVQLEMFTPEHGQPSSGELDHLHLS